MRKVIIESPFAGKSKWPAIAFLQRARNKRYARAAVLDCLRRGEAPIASHLLFTQPGILRDDVPFSRALGIEAGFAWYDAAEAIVFYADHGCSRGMSAALDLARRYEKKIEWRFLYRGDNHADLQKEA